MEAAVAAEAGAVALSLLHAGQEATAATASERESAPQRNLRSGFFDSVFTMRFLEPVSITLTGAEPEPGPLGEP